MSSADVPNCRDQSKIPVGSVSGSSDRAGEAGTESGSLLAVNTTGAIVGSLVIPFILMPTIGSPAIVVLLAAINLAVALGLALVADTAPR